MKVIFVLPSFQFLQKTLVLLYPLSSFLQKGRQINELKSAVEEYSSITEVSVLNFISYHLHLIYMLFYAFTCSWSLCFLVSHANADLLCTPYKPMVQLLHLLFSWP